MGVNTGRLIDELKDKNEQLSLKNNGFVGKNDLSKKMNLAKNRALNDITMRLNMTPINTNENTLIDLIGEYIYLMKEFGQNIEGDIDRLHFRINETKPINIEIQINDLVSTEEHNSFLSTLYVRGDDIYCEYVETCIMHAIYVLDEKIIPITITKKAYLTDEDINEYIEISCEEKDKESLIAQNIARELGCHVQGDNEMSRMNVTDVLSIDDIGRVSGLEFTSYYNAPRRIEDLISRRRSFLLRGLRMSRCIAQAYQNYQLETKNDLKR